MNICIIGMGYIGLPVAAMFASSGMSVTGVDILEEWCESINSCNFNIMEKDIESMAKNAVAEGRLYCRTEAVSADAFIIAVPTPILKDKSPDLSYVMNAADKVAHVLRKGNLVIVESTVPPNFTGGTLAPFLEERSGLKAGEDFLLAYCPERIMPGNIVHEIAYNARVIGGINRKSAKAARKLYSSFVKSEIMITDLITAEVSKLAENTYRDLNIAYANSLSLICEDLGCNVWEVINIANKHPRVDILQPGPGVGGQCIAVDPWFLIGSSQENAGLLRKAREINDKMPWIVAQKVGALVCTGGKIVILGCTYKADINDTRESPILDLKRLLESRYTVAVIDPYVYEYKLDLYKEAENADLIILGVNHRAFEKVDFERLAAVVKNKLFLDTRNSPLAKKAQLNGFCVNYLGDGSASSEKLTNYLRFV